MATENNKLNGWVKFLGAIIGLVLSLLILFITMIKPAVQTAVAEQVKVETVQRVEGDQKNYSWGSEEHKNLENRLEKRLDRMEVKIDRLLEQR
jgi:Na+-transporting methylmalonyl-CoA/oxaloacetate decarboxylase gamma subunit